MATELTPELTPELAAELTAELAAELNPELTAEVTAEVTADENAEISGRITHQRADNTRWQWTYNAGINHGTDNDVTGTVYKRSELGTEGSEVRFQ